MKMLHYRVLFETTAHISLHFRLILDLSVCETLIDTYSGVRFFEALDVASVVFPELNLE